MAVRVVKVLKVFQSSLQFSFLVPYFFCLLVSVFIVVSV